jgi:hypothetical protein
MKELDTDYGVGGMVFNPAAPPKDYVEKKRKIQQDRLNDYNLIDQQKKPLWQQQGVDPRKVEYESQVSGFLNSVLK